MKFARFWDGTGNRYGIAEDGWISEVEGSIYGEWRATDRKHPETEVELLAPCEPSKIVCVGLNYRDHAAEVKIPLPSEPILFLKPPSSVIGQRQPVVKPAMCRRLDYEAELAVVIGREARRVHPSEAQHCILGYTCGNDVTARDLQPKEGQWTLSKSFDTFCPLGPFIVTGIDPSNLDVKLWLNGQVRQHSSTSHLIFSVEKLVSYISAVMTLLPGDVILTGTPSGIAPMNRGDEVVVEIQDLGRLTNPVIAETV